MVVFPGTLSTLKLVASRVARAAFVASCLPTASLAEEQPIPVTAVIARSDAIAESVDVFGTLAAREEVQVHPLVAGKEIREIFVEAGQHVNQGEALASLDTTEAQMLLDKNTVSLRRARAAVAVERSRVDLALIGEEEARRKLERSRALQPKGAIADNVLEEHQNAYARAGAELRLARQSLELAEAEEQMIGSDRKEIELAIDRSTIRAPRAGRILKRSARIGAMTAGAGEALFLIAADDSIEFVAEVTEASFVRMRHGMRVQVTLPNIAQPVEGTIRLNAAQLEPKTRSGTVRVELAAAEGLVPGLFGRGTIKLAVRRNIFVPGSAVKNAGGTSNVYVVSGGVVDVRTVRTGWSQNGLVEITEGINDGEVIALRAGAFLKAEDRVRLVMTASPELRADGPVTAPSDDQVGALVR